MKDRVSTQILGNGALRYAEYDSAGNFVQYRYLLVADEPIEEGSAWSKANALPDTTCATLGIATTSELKDAFNAIPGIMLYQKIRDITDATGMNAVSVDISDVNWDDWREIRFVGEVTHGNTFNSGVYLRVNSLSSGYSGINSIPIRTSLEATLTEMVTITTPIGSASAFDVSLYSINGYVSYVVHIGQGHGQASGVPEPIKAFGYHRDAINLASFDLVLGGIATISIKNVSLWGVKR